MIVQIRKSGGSFVVTIPVPMMKVYDFKEGDFVNISDIFKVEKK